MVWRAVGSRASQAALAHLTLGDAVEARRLAEGELALGHAWGAPRAFGRDLVLFGDTFNRYFEPENLAAAEQVLEAAGYRLHRAATSGAG